jgi:aryl-alcohol dehydrogenase-like predicted oxidoreductase
MRYKIFGNTGLRVSELCLGTMTFGTEWDWGTDYAGSSDIFDTYVEAGGNFIDTANNYTNGSSEKFLGEFIAKERDRFVLATKFTFRDSNAEDRIRDPNFSGNHLKNMRRSVEASLKRLNTDFIDILWIHAWDFLTPVEELMRNLDDLVRTGKVLHIGISDTPAWIVAQANTLAQLRGWKSFSGLQIEYSLTQRSAERDLLPMSQHFGMTVTNWSPLAGGVLTGKYLNNESGRQAVGSPKRSERNLNISEVVVNVAKAYGYSPSQVAIAFTRRNNLNTIPILGARTVTQLQDCLGAAQIILPEEAIIELESVSKIEKGFPHDFLNSQNIRDLMYNVNHEKIIRK